MAVGYLLAAPDSLLEQLSPLLQTHGVSCNQTDETTVTHGRRTFDLITYECVDGSASVELGVEKRLDGLTEEQFRWKPDSEHASYRETHRLHRLDNVLRQKVEQMSLPH